MGDTPSPPLSFSLALTPYNGMVTPPLAAFQLITGNGETQKGGQAENWNTEEMEGITSSIRRFSNKAARRRFFDFRFQRQL